MNDSLNNMKPYLYYVQLAFTILFWVLIGLISASIVGVLLAKLCKIACCRILIHFGWCCTSWMIILSLLLGVILFLTGIIMNDSCYSLSFVITPESLGNL